MSDLTPSFITLNTGLDLQSPKIAASPGTALDMLNYEQVDFQGQKRIDGYVRYDGSMGSYIDDYLLVHLPTPPPSPPQQRTMFTISQGVEVGQTLLGNKGLPFAVVLEIVEGGSAAAVAVIDETQVSSLQSEHIWGRDLGLTPEEHYLQLLAYNQVLRDRATDLPGPVAGLHWFRDRLYAVASVPVVEGTGVNPNETWEGYPVLKVRDGYVYLGTTHRTQENYSDVASFFVARSETQALEDLGSAALFGWEFQHQGWNVYFENGVSLYGSLAALNQNRQDVGVQGPSSIAGDSGRPLLLIQNIPTTNLPQQVQGWKTSTFADVFNLDSGALREVDGTYIYADAHVTWDGETGAVVAETLNLQQYSAANAVVVEV